ncbi:amidohydrolase family protein [Robiginitalea myxolifaciens]|nr:amidohydrolase family protein [Robiginitalea myxolifaciens]
MDSILPNQTLLITGDRIEFVGATTDLNPTYEVVNGEGKYVIPGLIDTHIHPYQSKNDLLLYLANGITHVAIMNSWDGLYLKWREEAKNGGLSPDIFVAAGPMNTARDIRSKIYGRLGPIPVYNDPETTQRAVREFKALGYDGLKAYSLDRENYLALSEEAERQNIPMLGHVTPAISLSELFESNQSQIAHVEEITKAIEREFGGRSKIYYENTEAYLDFVRAKADEIAVLLKDKDITVSTTIDVYPRAKAQDLDLNSYLKSIELEYLNPGILEGSIFNPGWLPGGNRYEDPWNTDPEGIKRAELYWDTYTEAVNIMTRALFRNKVRVTVGTDAGNPGIIAGFSMHDEMEQLCRIGIDELDVLKAATVQGSQWLNAGSGGIAQGQQANLVLLDANPLNDIRNTRSIHGVLIKGKYLCKSQLDELLARVRNANRESRKVSITQYLE